MNWRPMPSPRGENTTILICRAGDPTSIRTWYVADHKDYRHCDDIGFTHWAYVAEIGVPAA